MQFNLSWKTIAIIALIVIGLIVISREIRSWLIMKEAKSIFNQVQHNIAEHDKSIQESRQRMAEMANKFDKAVDSDINETDRRIEETGKQINAIWQKLDKERKEQPPMRSYEEFQRDFEKLRQQMMREPLSHQEANRPESK